MRVMDFALIYLFQRFFYRIGEFLRHWYIKSVRIYWNAVFNRLEGLDYYFAWRITARHLFEPLYKDYSIIGYILGFIFRTLRLVIASVIYVCIFGIAIALYALWVLLPIYFMIRIIHG